MRRPVNNAKAIATIERATAETTDTRSCHEVQGEIVATGIMVPSPGIPRERPTGRNPMLAQQHKKRSTETGLVKDSVETSDGNELGSVEPTRTWRTNSSSRKRNRDTVGKPAGLEVAIRRQLPDLPRSEHSPVYTLMAPYQPSECASTTSGMANLWE